MSDVKPELTRAMIVGAVNAGHYPVLSEGDLELRIDDDNLIMVSVEEDDVIEATLVKGPKGQRFESFQDMVVNSNDKDWITTMLKRGDRNDFS